MKRMFSGLQRRVTSPLSSSTQDSPSPTSSGNESPEATIVREIKAFCESGGGPSNASNDYLHLPAIVEAAESSANAAKEAASQIRKNLSRPAKVSGGVQYNSLMLIRILSENPGHTFTRNFDAKFVSTIKDLLRDGRDMPAQQMLRETLDLFETQKSWDEDLAGLIAMWKKEKERASKYTRSPPPPPAGQATSQYPQPGFRHPAPPRQGQLPPPDELASRISEAKNSANLLIQLAQSTPAAEVQSHELLREFSQRCQTAYRSIQVYMAMENPPPDENTMLTLIETNEQLSVALSKYQRTILNARKAMGTATPPVPAPGVDSNGTSPPPAVNGHANGNGTLNGNTTNLIDIGPDPRNETASSGAMHLLPSHSSLDEPFSATVLPSFRAPIEAPTEVPADYMAKRNERTGSITPPTASTRYEYNADEFAVENPFADHAADAEHGHDPRRIDFAHEPSRREI